MGKLCGSANPAWRGGVTLTEAYLEAHVMRLPDSPGCWLWTGASKRHGYGVVSDGRLRSGNHRKSPAHRKVYELLVGPIPPGSVLRHSCDVPACVNPAHLKPGTQGDNIRDAVARGRICRGDRKPGIKLRDSDVPYVHADLRRGVAGAEIARQYGVSLSLISRIKLGLARQSIRIEAL